MHICLLCAIYLTKNKNFKEEDIYKLHLPVDDMENIFNKVQIVLKDAIDKYNEKDKSENVMNIAKQKTFTEFLINNVSDKELN